MYDIFLYMQRKFVISEGEYYHLYNRGVDKRIIFLDDKDRRRFIKLLYVANGERSFVFRDIEDRPLVEIDRGEPLVAIGAHVLMSNHFHILVKEIKKGGTSAFMEKLLTGYSSYFNKRHGRSGSLFQGTYKAEHLNRDPYLKYIFSYIHLNPIKIIEPKWRETGIHNIKRAKDFLERYQYSSYLDHAGAEREEGSILSVQEFPAYFSTTREFREVTKEWLKYKDSSDT